MTVIATAVRHLMAAGVTGDALVTAIEEMEAAMGSSPKTRSAGAERQARYRERERNKASQVTESDACDVTPNTLDKKAPQTPKKINPKSPPISPQFADDFVETWNEAAKGSGLTKAMPLNRERKAKLKRRVSEFGEGKLRQAVANLAASPFHCGENDRGWKAGIGWLLKNDENVTKALELSARAPPGKSNDYLDHFLARHQ